MAGEDLEAHRDAGQPAAELVCRIGGEVTLGRQHPVDPGAAHAQRVGDPVDLGDLRGRQLGGAEVTVAEAGRGRRDAFEGTGELAGLHGGQAGRGEDGAGGQHQQDVRLLAEAVVERGAVRDQLDLRAARSRPHDRDRVDDLLRDLVDDHAVGGRDDP